MLFSWWLNEIDRFKFVTPKYIILTKKNNIFIIIPKLIKSLSIPENNAILQSEK